MSNTYDPKQELSFLFKRSENKLYVNSKITVSIKENDTLSLDNDPQMDSEATIVFKASATDKATINPATKEIQILLN